MSAITPLPPGFAVGITTPPEPAFAPPATSNAFVAGVFERGTLAQASSIGALTAKLGGRMNNSLAVDDAAVLLAEGAGTVTATRVTGADARAASLGLRDGSGRVVATIAAGSVGEWGNDLKAAFIDEGGGLFRVVVTVDDVPLATSPATSAIADLNAWGDGAEHVDFTGTALPVASAAAPLTGGTADLTNLRPSDWATALDRLDRRYGPGVLRLPGVTDPAIHELALEHGRLFNREPHLDLARGVSKSTAIGHAQTVRADLDEPEDARNGGVWATWCFSRPIGGEPERLVPYGAVQAGIACRVDAEQGVGIPPFGTTNGRPRTVVRLDNEWSDQDRHDLYVEGVNVAVNDGFALAAWGYRTLDLDENHCDLHHRHVRMAIKHAAELVAPEFIGAPINARTLARVHARLEGIGRDFQAIDALDAFQVDVDSVNTAETAARRWIWGVLSIRQTPTADWVAITIPILPIA